jgi:hypothetical protein
MSELDRKLNSDDIFVPEEGQRDFLSSNKESLRCPSFGINPNQVPEDVALDYFAGILVQAFLDKKEHEHNQLHKSKTSSDIRACIDEGAS